MKTRKEMQRELDEKAREEKARKRAAGIERDRCPKCGYPRQNIFRDRQWELSCADCDV